LLSLDRVVFIGQRGDHTPDPLGGLDAVGLVGD
jgi:hypothetical protein